MTPTPNDSANRRSADERLAPWLDGDTPSDAPGAGGDDAADREELTDGDEARRAADLQLLHALLIQAHGRDAAGREARIQRVMQVVDGPLAAWAKAPSQPWSQAMRSPAARWAMAASVLLVSAVAIFFSQSSNPAMAALDQLIEATNQPVDRTYEVSAEFSFNASSPGRGPGRFGPPRRPSGDFGRPGPGGPLSRPSRSPADAPAPTSAPATGPATAPGTAPGTAAATAVAPGGDDDRASGATPASATASPDAPEPTGAWPSRKPPFSASPPDRGPWRHGRGGWRPPHRPLPMNGATLYMRGGDQFVLRRPLPGGDEVVIGCNGRQSWLVRPSGAVLVSDDPAAFRGPLPQVQTQIPFVNVKSGLVELRKHYDLRELEPQPLASDDNTRWRRLQGRCHSSDYRGPQIMHIWSDPQTGVMRRLVIEGRDLDGRPGPIRLTVDLVSQAALASDWFDHEAHHEPDRTVEYVKR